MLRSSSTANTAPMAPPPIADSTRYLSATTSPSARTAVHDNVTAMADQKNKDEWDELDEKEGEPGISPEIARALLATNPALRKGGMDTDLLMKQHKSAQTGNTPKPAPMN